MRLCSASEMGCGETNKSLFCPLCTPQGSPLVYAVCLRQEEKRELKPLCLDRDKIVIADFTGLLALRHSGTVHPSHRCAARSLGGGRSRQLQRKTSAFSGIVSFTLAATVSMWRRTPLQEKGFYCLLLHREF